ncbi:MAG: gamma-glutamyltransferase [Candidatus Freyarchaeota archaeon]|nr:gamma-glutamyltransferase [Candidatus Jordarchaeia archaeon]
MPSIYPVTRASNGMVVSPHRLASIEGLKVLKREGNAVDAAIATNMVLAVAYPHMCGLGGDAFLLIYDVDEDRIYGLNASGRAPYAAKRDLFRSMGFSSIPVRGMLPVTVPGVVDGWCTAIERFGTKTLSELIQPAIEYAERGVPITDKFYWFINSSIDVLTSSPKLAEMYMRGGRIIKPGEVLVQKELAATLRKLAEGGRNEFYRGELAESIAKFSEENGGLITKRDLQDHKSDWVEPIKTQYRGYEVYTFPPNSQGVATLIELNIIEGFELSQYGWQKPETIHLMVEAKKCAFKVRDQYVTDPDFVEIPLSKLLSKEYASQLRENIYHERKGQYIHHENAGEGDTVYLAVVDKEGNAVSLIQSIYYPFGSGVVVGDTGIILQNRGAYFSLDEKHVNRLEPHKRTLHTLSPLMVFKDQRPFLVMGTMGGDGQPQTHMQVISNIIDFGMDVQESIEAPRWVSTSFKTNQHYADILMMEKRFPQNVLSKLESMGHKVSYVEEWSQMMGHAQAIMVKKNGKAIYGGADPRGDSAAFGW